MWEFCESQTEKGKCQDKLKQQMTQKSLCSSKVESQKVKQNNLCSVEWVRERQYGTEKRKIRVKWAVKDSWACFQLKWNKLCCLVPALLFNKAPFLQSAGLDGVCVSVVSDFTT